VKKIVIMQKINDMECQNGKMTSAPAPFIYTLLTPLWREIEKNSARALF
jgi:hypothetical protein